MKRNDESDHEYAKYLIERQKEIERNPLSQYSTTELKRELQRRKKNKEKIKENK